MQCDLKNLPLGLPLTVASVGTIATLWAGKNLHAGFGIAWAALTFFHGWQSRCLQALWLHVQG